MPTRDHAPLGAPCWTDLFTSDVDGARSFYGELFGWEALEPSPEFGGYFMFARDGVPTAGGMGDMGDTVADDRWTVYFNTDDAARTVREAADKGAAVHIPATPVADLGTQARLADPTGASFGLWQPGTFHGFAVTSEHAAPSWFELLTTDYAGSTAFYGSVLRWQLSQIADTDEFRYSVMMDPEFHAGELAGIMDASGMPGTPASAWSIYWHVDDADEAASAITKLGGRVVDEPADTPYGRLAGATDPMGAPFKLRQAPAAQ